MTIDGNKSSTVFEALKHYPGLYRHPIMLYNVNKDYNAIKAPDGELEYQYSRLPYILNSYQKSDVRHPLTNALFVRNYPGDFVKDLGEFKEEVDLQNGRTVEDTEADLQNNEFGINLGQRYIFAPNTFLFDNVLQHSGLPVPARNNTLYGYIDNLPDNEQELNKWELEQKNNLFQHLMNPTGL